LCSLFRLADGTALSSQTNGSTISRWHTYIEPDGGITSLDSPENLLVSTTAGNVVLHWDMVQYATSYQVFSTSNLYTDFVLDTTGTVSGTTWTAPSTGERKYYQVKAVR
jgi:hypothetical protein